MRHHRRLNRRRERGLAYANPMAPSAVSEALYYLGIGAGVGGALGGVGGGLAKPPDILSGALGGASIGVGLTALGGFIVGLVQPQNRNAGFAAAGIGWGSLILVNVISNVASSTSAKTA
jgi:hypothetical protein